MSRLKKNAEARRDKESKEANNKGSGNGETNPNKPLSLAEEMKLKLLRRQKALSGQRDEEEQAAAAARRKVLSAPVTAVSVIGKLRARAEKTRSNRRLRVSSNEDQQKIEGSESESEAAVGGFSFKKMPGLIAFLDAKDSSQSLKEKKNKSKNKAKVDDLKEKLPPRGFDSDGDSSFFESDGWDD